MKIETNLVASDLSRCDPVAIEIPYSEWQCLKEFFRLAEKLRASRFVREGRGGSIGFSWKPGEGILAKSKEIEEEPVLAMLLLLRPFILNRERSFLPKIVKLLKRKA